MFRKILNKLPITTSLCDKWAIETDGMGETNASNRQTCLSTYDTLMVVLVILKLSSNGFSLQKILNVYLQMMST